MKDLLNKIKGVSYRKKLIPIWVRFFMLIVIFWTLIMAATLIFTVFDLKTLPYGISLYGLKSKTSLSWTGALIQFLFLYKAIVAVLLWREHKHAVNLAIIDALTGLIFMIFYFIQSLNPVDQGWNYDVRFELFLLIPYLIAMLSIRPKWLTAEK